MIRKVRKYKTYLIVFLAIIIIAFRWRVQTQQLLPANEQLLQWQGASERLTNKELQEIRDFIASTPNQSYEFYYYNLELSNRIGAFRQLPQTASDKCQQGFGQLLRAKARVSIIIVFHNEARSTLLRTLLSIFLRTPARHLHEVILIDDCSNDESLLSELLALNIWSILYKHAVILKTHRNSQRAGLISSRNYAANLSSGDYLLFLDSHCEVNSHWLEPLLQHMLNSNGRAAVSPVIDIIEPETLRYKSGSARLMGGFDWHLHFHWIPRVGISVKGEQQVDEWRSYRSPLFAGGIFLISRSWFLKLNAFNANLQTWGGESIEFALKLWLCGGQIEIVPCSRVGHIFRQQHPFVFPNSQAAAAATAEENSSNAAAENGQATYLRNSKIIADSWLDEYKNIFYALKPQAAGLSVDLPHDELKRFKNDLQCKSFEWYLGQVFPQLS